MARIGDGCGQSRGLCAPLQRLMRQALRRQVTRRAPAPAPECRPTRPTRQRRHGSHPPRRRPLQRLMRRSVRRQRTRRVQASAPECRPTRPARQRRARPMARHLRGRQPTVQRALTAAVEQRWPASRSGSAFQQRRCHPAAPEYRRRAEPRPPTPRRHVSSSAPAARIRLRAEPSRPLPRQLVSCSATAAVMRPRCPHPSVAARYRRRAGRGGPLSRAPSAPPGRPVNVRSTGGEEDPEERRVGGGSRA